jgi:hypothetical protein
VSVTVLEPGSNRPVRALARHLDIPAGAASVSRTILDSVFADRCEDAAFVAALDRCSHENVANLVEVLTGRLALHDVDAECPREFAALAARLGIPLAELERAYWVGVERLWQEWFELCHTSSRGASTELRDLLGGSTSLLFGYVDRVLAQVVARYGSVHEEMAATREDRRRELVAALLNGEPTALSEAAAEELLGYRLRRTTHVALWFESDDARRITRALATLRTQTSATGSLLVRGDGGTWYGWLGYLGKGRAGVLSDLRRAAAATGELVTLGDPRGGQAGFRTSHEGARRTAALRGSLHAPEACLSAHELRLEALLLESPDSARRFVEDELGGLAADSERAGRTRDTLLAWLASGSQAQAAVELGVHENTVRQRIRYAAEELGTSPSERRTELLVALRLCAALGPQASEADPGRTEARPGRNLTPATR